MMHIFLTKGGYVLVEWHDIMIETNGYSRRAIYIIAFNWDCDDCNNYEHYLQVQLI